jgi:hypothetical protein
MPEVTESANLSCTQAPVTATNSVHVIVGGANARKVRIINRSSELVHYRFGDGSAVAVAFTGSPLVGDPVVAPGTTEDIWSRESTHVALVTKSGTATVEIQAVQYKA